MASEFAAIEQGSNKSGKVFALWRKNATGKFWVWARCANYSGTVHGGLSYTWRYVARDLNETEARALFARKLKGKQK